MRRAAALALPALALFVMGCGSGDSTTPVTGLPAEAELRGSTAAERKVAAEVRHYLEINCATPGTIEKIPQRELKDPRNRFYVRDLEAMEAMCGHLASIEVDGLRVTIRSDVEPRMQKAAGSAFCNLIYGSDVADETPGHELQNLESTTIKRCPVSP